MTAHFDIYIENQGTGQKCKRLGVDVLWSGLIQNQFKDWLIRNPEHAKTAQYVLVSNDDGTKPAVFIFKVKVSHHVEVEDIL